MLFLDAAYLCEDLVAYWKPLVCLQPFSPSLAVTHEGRDSDHVWIAELIEEVVCVAVRMCLSPAP